MAKLNSVLIPKASGSIGNITFRSVGRNTVASEKIVTNTSRTAAQVAQRVSFKDRMAAIKPIKQVAPYLYKKKGFRSPYAELASRVMLLSATDFNDWHDQGFAFYPASIILEKPIVEGDVTATSVQVNATTKQIDIIVPAANFEPRKSVDPYGVTQAAVVYSSVNNAELGMETLVQVLDITDSEQVRLSKENDNLRISLFPTEVFFVEERRVSVPSVNVNGKRIGFLSMENVTPEP